MFPFTTLLDPNLNLNRYSDCSPSNSPEVFVDKIPSDIKHEPTEPLSGKSQSCNICGRVLSSASSYYVHMKMHSDNKPFHCTSCEASFCRKPYLDAHIRTHTGEKPFVCNYCTKAFTQKSSLNTHKRMHTGERPYSCDLCGKRFAVKSYVTAHRWTHIGEKPLSCSYCSLNFTSKHQFAMHIKTHLTSDHNFNCEVCGRKFSKESYLIRHHYRVHKGIGKQRSISKADSDTFIDPDL